MGYGNAIVRPLAVAFIESAIEAFTDAARAANLIPVTVVSETQEDAA